MVYLNFFSTFFCNQILKKSTGKISKKANMIANMKYYIGKYAYRIHITVVYSLMSNFYMVF